MRSRTGLPLFLAAMFPLLICSGKNLPETFDLLAMPGMEKQSELFPGDTFRPFSKIIKPYGSSRLVVNPERIPVFFTVFNGLKLDPSAVYELKIRFAGQEGTKIIIDGTECAKGKILKKNILLNATSALNVNGMTTCSKEFAVTPDCEQLIPALTVANPGKNGHAKELLVEELSIRRTGQMKTAPFEIRQINLASDYDFSKYPEGEFKKIYKGSGPNAAKWSNIKAEIVTLDGKKVLHIVRTPENYIYPFLELKKFPIDPKYHRVKVSFKAKGNVSVKPGLWWKRPSLNWDYYHGRNVQLNDEWQTVTLIHPCLTSDVGSATMSFTSGDNGEFWIRDISVTLE